MAKRARKQAATLTATVRLHAVHEPEQNGRIVDGCRFQRGVHNRVVAHLLQHRSDEPLYKNERLGVTGVFGILAQWRKEDETLRAMPSVTARGAAAGAWDQVAKWETANEEQAVAVAKAMDKAEPIPRRAQRRLPDSRTLFRSRKQEERSGRHRYRVDEKVRRIASGSPSRAGGGGHRGASRWRRTRWRSRDGAGRFRSTRPGGPASAVSLVPRAGRTGRASCPSPAALPGGRAVGVGGAVGGRRSSCRAGARSRGFAGVSPGLAGIVGSVGRAVKLLRILGACP